MSTDYCSCCKYENSLTCASCSNYQGVPDCFEEKAEIIRFYLDGCDICFVAEAPADMTLEQLLKQADRINPHWCTCGVRSLYNKGEEKLPTEIKFDYDDVIKVDPDAPCDINPKGEENKNG